MALNLPVASWHPNPLYPLDGRVISYEPFEDDECIGAYIDRMGWHDAIDRPSQVTYNGRVLTRAEWLEIAPREGDQIAVQARLADGESDVGRTILTLAVLIAAVAVPQLIGGLSTIQSAMVSAAINLGGMMIVNAIAPMDTKEDKGESNESNSYSVSGASNNIRPYEPLPIVVGRHRVFPDVDEKPYTWFEARSDGDDQYLAQTFNFGLGTLELSAHRFGETAIEDLGVQDLTIGKTTIDNYDVAEGNELQFSTGWVSRTSPVDTVEIAIDLGGVAAEYNKTGTPIGKTVNFQAEYKAFGSGTWLPMTFPSLVIGYTPDSFEEVIVGDSGTTMDIPPAGAGWFLYDDSPPEAGGS